MGYAIIIAIACGVALVAWEAGWRDGHKYGRARGWAAGVRTCHGNKEWCERSQTQAEAILAEPRRDIRWP